MFFTEEVVGPSILYLHVAQAHKIRLSKRYGNNVKLRAPRRFATAVTRIKKALGEEACAQAVDRSVSLIRKWADPDHSSRPNLPQAVALDVAYVEAGHGEPPILSMYQARLAKSLIGEAPEQTIDVVLSALAVQAAVGEISQSLIQSRENKNRAIPGFSAIERNQILNHLETLQEQVVQIENALESNDEPFE